MLGNVLCYNAIRNGVCIRRNCIGCGFDRINIFDKYQIGNYKGSDERPQQKEPFKLVYAFLFQQYFVENQKNGQAGRRF